MNHLKLTAILLAALACDSKVNVTDGKGTSGTGLGPEEAQLQSVLIQRCRTICKNLSTCPASCECAVDSTSAPASDSGYYDDEISGDVASGGSDSSTSMPVETSGSGACECGSSTNDFDGCLSECVGDLADRFLNNGETCAAAANDALDCMAVLDCVGVDKLRSNGDTCGVKAAMELCPGEDSAVTVAAPTPIAVPTSAMGGASGEVGGVAGSVGTGAAPTVTCGTGSGGGKAPTPGIALGPNEDLCDQQYSGCSDGHEYRVFCGTNAESVVKCYCVFDGKAQVIFEDPDFSLDVPANNACFNVDLANQRCGWSLSGPNG